jgi:hypothetical protein
MAQFADVAATLTSGKADFMDAFAVLTPESALPLAAEIAGVVGTNGPDFVKLNIEGPLSTSGYDVMYQDTNNANLDQGHHFAGLFQLGYHAEALIGAFGAVANEMVPSGNMGDVRLGLAAVELGTKVSSGEVKPTGVGDYIRKNLCAH